jgi:tetratricopeptide (TPR) repeat protein
MKTILTFAFRAALVLYWAATLKAQGAPDAARLDLPDKATTEWSQHLKCGEQHHLRRELALAEDCFRSAIRVAGSFGESDLRLGTAVAGLGTVLLEQGRMSEAEAAHVRAVVVFRNCTGEHCTAGLARAVHNLAILYTQQYRLFEAEKLLTEALALQTRTKSGDTEQAQVLQSLGWIALYRRRPKSAEAYFRRGLLLTTNAGGAEDIRGTLYASLSATLLALHQPQEALHAAREALASVYGVPGIGPDTLARHYCTLAAAGSAAGDLALAEVSLARAMEVLPESTAQESSTLAFVLSEFAHLRFSQKRYTESAELFRRSLQIFERHVASGHPQLLAIKENYAHALRKANRRQESDMVKAEMRAAEKDTPPDPRSRHSVDVTDLRGER